MRSLDRLTRTLDHRFAAALVAVPLAACGGSTGGDDAGKDGTLDVISSGCMPTSSPTCGCPPPTTIMYVACAADASDDAAASDAGGDAAACYPSCSAACIAQGHPGNICTEEGTDGGMRVAQCVMGCGVGRRPDGLRAELTTPGVAGYLAEAAWLEAASVRAFTRLARELEAHGAPRWLIREARRAARDEVRHARSMSRLARARGARIPRVRVAKTGVRSLEAIARENAVEGCVGEMFGALVASWQGAHAADPSIRRTMKRIAPDETRHAALSLAVAKWIEPRLSRSAATRVRRAREQAASELARTPETVSGPAVELGLPQAHERAALARALFGARASERGRPFSVVR